MLHAVWWRLARIGIWVSREHGVLAQVQYTLQSHSMVLHGAVIDVRVPVMLWRGMCGPTRCISWILLRRVRTKCLVLM